MFVFVFSACVLCGNPFGYNPNSVPSLKVDGHREPVCLSCHTRANAVRRAHGLAPWPDPLPDAYEPIDERELRL